MLALALVATVFAVDLCLPLGVASAVPYTFAVLLALGAKPGWVGPAVAALCMVLTVAKVAVVPDRGDTELWKVIANRCLALFAVGMTTLLGVLRRRADERSRQHEADLARLSRLAVAGELATVLAHELNQPLAAVCLQADIAVHLARESASPTEFLATFAGKPGCLVLDVRMPGMTGLELQRALADAGATLPVVMISGHADVRTAVEAMTRGAVTLLEKPFRLGELLSHVSKGLERDAAQRAARESATDAGARLAALTAKEREVLDLIATGRTNREMADALGLSVWAVEDRRARLMKKVHAGSVAELVRLLSVK